MSEATQETLGSILLRYHLVREEDLKEALDEQHRTHGRLGETLIRMGYLKEDVLTWCLATQLNIPCVSAIDTRPDRLDLEALNRLPPELAHRYHVIPLLFSGNELTVVTDDPLDRHGLAEIEQVTGLKLNVAAGPTSEILRALEELYGADPALMPPPAEAIEYAGDPEAGSLQLLESWLERMKAAGQHRFLIEPHGSGGQVRVRARGPGGASYPLDGSSFETLMASLLDICGLERVIEPVLRPFTLGSHGGTVAFGHSGRGLMAVVAIEEALGALYWPAGWSAALRSGLRGPGLWLLGVNSSRLWRPLVRSMMNALEPERRVLAPGEGRMANLGRDRFSFSPEALEGVLGLEPDVLLLPAFARQTVIDRLRCGLPDTSLVLQVAARTPLRALQILRSSGLTGAEMAELVRGVLCVATLEQRCAGCRSRERQLESSMRLAVGGEGMSGVVEDLSSPCPVCADSGAGGEVPVLSWVEVGMDMEGALAAEEPIAGLKRLLVPGPVPEPHEQVQAYLEQGWITGKTAEDSGIG